VVAVLSLVTIHATTKASEPASTGAAIGLNAMHTWAFLLGPAVMSAINALLLGSLLFRSGLVPRWIPTLGLLGAPLLLASSVGVILGGWDQTSTIGALAALPIAVWEFALGLRLTLKGFAHDALAALSPVTPVREAMPAGG
jgi:hypothetical protein